MPMRRHSAFTLTAARSLAAVAALALLASCGSLSEERRQAFRMLAYGPGSENLDRGERVAECMAVLGESDPRGSDTQMRWQAAANLGMLRAAEARQLLWSRAFSALADRSAQVRRECVIALTKLPFEGPNDLQRLELIEKLRTRAAFERSETLFRQLVERDPTVRMALIEGLVTLGLPENRDADAWAVATVTGRRDCAAALHTVLVALNAETSDRAEAIELGASNRYSAGLLESCIRGLMVLTATAPQEASEARSTRTMAEFIVWWVGRVDAIPSSVQ